MKLKIPAAAAAWFNQLMAFAWLIVMATFAPLSPSPHAGWRLVEGGSNLIEGAYWGALSRHPDDQVSVVNNILTIRAGSNDLSGTNFLAPWLIIKSDFGVVVTMNVGSDPGGGVTISNSLQTGPEFWQGIKRLDFGVDDRRHPFVQIWDGTRPSPASYQTLAGGPLSGEVTIEAIHQGNQFTMWVNGALAGRITDAGGFATGYVIPGILVSSGKETGISGLAYEVPDADAASAMVATPLGPVTPIHPGDSLRSLAAITGRTFGIEQVSAPLIAFERLMGLALPAMLNRIDQGRSPGRGMDGI